MQSSRSNQRTRRPRIHADTFETGDVLLGVARHELERLNILLGCEAGGSPYHSSSSVRSMQSLGKRAITIGG
eukprot:1823847-Amphidinium_carterae.1